MSNFSRILLLIIFICLIALLISACDSAQERVQPLKPCEVVNTFSGPVDWTVTTYTREQRCEGYVLSIEAADKKYRLHHECQTITANMETQPGTYSIGLVACGAYTSGTACVITIQTTKGQQEIQTRIGTMNQVTI